MFSTAELEKMSPRERESCLLAFVNVKLLLASTWIGSGDPPKVAKALEAIRHNTDVWAAFSRDFGSAGNALPQATKASLADLHTSVCAISTRAIERLDEADVRSLIAINTCVVQGLQTDPSAAAAVT